jgi:transcriptional regulator with XRE-family HTH domain
MLKGSTVVRSTLHTRLEQVRRARGLTQKRLAALARITPQEVCRIERGWMRPTPTRAARLARALDLTPHELDQPAARARTSGEYRLGRAIGSILSTNGPSDKPGTIHTFGVLVASPFSHWLGTDTSAVCASLGMAFGWCVNWLFARRLPREAH